jgi:NAD(P)-dependent dehydrogenase (short-subunit alcohol dehydrogenase family)
MNIVMTGVTSGIGQAAAALLVARGHIVHAGVRGAGAPRAVTTSRLDMSSLAGARTFAEGITELVDSVVLNAGMQRLDVDARTVDGYEETFAVNHLAHYLLARLLLPKIKNGGRLIFTSSGTHDPSEKTGIPPPRHADARKLSDPATDPKRDANPRVAGQRAYSTSKLCNLMTARHMASLPDVVARNITVHAFDPGFIPATGLARNYPAIIRGLVLPVLGLITPLAPGMNTLAAGGAGLAGLSDGTITSDRMYMALRKGAPTWPNPSALARDDQACAKLWADSAAMVGLTP